ncbi:MULTISPECIES: alanine/glycine:cation symporter family protein [Vibrio]|uniref:Amino acid carrier protein n=2 Tax=Vibrio TaxID=662 RepID=A0A7X4LJ38_9VIBR|nr:MULTISPECIES: alanine/glycine:cation symporter family protein [Vibrio]MBF9002890.1 alanine:cation symporter family protein [Vibrio nitrifigilis]MZI92869.1 amino acid carrier protein [Vibrio eleionomae]
MEFLQSFFGLIGDLTWGTSLIPFLVIFGVFFTIVTDFVQFRFFKRMFSVLKKPAQTGNKDTISGREALLLSIGGRVGGGNIAGVAVAITLGGPGAVFWMWAIALVGMATSLVECTLAQLYKRKDGNEFRGGASRAIVHGLGKNYRWLATAYSVCLIASFALGFNAFQGNTVAGAAQDSLGIDRIYTGIFLAIVVAFIIYGGIKRIAKTADVIVPIMAVAYVAIAIITILMNITHIPHVLTEIFENAFGIKTAVSGGMGAAIAQGLRRGLFSNEAGLGSAPNVAATADVPHPVSQGIAQSLSVFIDTMVVCSCTAFIILLGDVYVPGAQGIDGVVLTQQSLVSHLGGWTQYYLTFAILLFSFSSVVYNYYLGENALTSMTQKKLPVHVLRWAVVALVFIGAVAPSATDVFFFSDPLMGVLAIINLLALIMLFPTAMRLLQDYRKQLKQGIEEPVFNPDDFKDLDIDREAWVKQ